MSDDVITHEWRSCLQRWAKSGLSGADFAAQEGVSVSTLYRWARRLELGPVQRRRGRPRQGVQPTLIPVIVKPDLSSQPEPAPMLEVLMRGGEVVRVPQGFDDDTLVRVVRALGGGQ